MAQKKENPDFRTVFSVSVRVLSASNLRKADSLGKSDPYCIFNIGPRKYKTKIIYKTLDPEWNEHFGFTFEELPKIIDCQVFDHDFASKDDFLGSLEISLDDLLKKGGPVDINEDLQKTKTGSIKLNVEVKKISQIITSTAGEQELDLENLVSLADLTIVGASELKPMDRLGTNDPYAIISFGTHSYKTQVINNTNEPLWNQHCPLWLHKASKNHVIKISVFDADISKAELIGHAYLKPALIDYGKPTELVLSLTNDNPSTDAELAVLMRTISFNEEKDKKKKEKSALGVVKVKITHLPRDEVAKTLYKGIMDLYDVDQNGKIELEELVHLLHTLHSPLKDDEINDLFAKYDKDKDGSLVKEEVVNLLNSKEVQTSEIAKKIHTRMIHGEQAVDRMIMSGFLDADDDNKADIDNSGSQLMIQDRSTGLVVTENIPAYIKSAMRLLYRNSVGNKISGTGKIKALLRALTVREGKKMDSPNSLKNLDSFIATHKLDLNEVLLDRNEFKTFNEFFYRQLKPGARTCDAPNDDNVACSPADCRMMVFRTIDDAKKLWIKGSDFTLSNLFGKWDADGQQAKKFIGGSLVIARLAPQDYHRWHFPVSGVQKERFLIEGEYITVNPLAIRMDVNVYTDNKRCICPIQTKEFGLVVLIAVAASMVGSINFVESKDYVDKAAKKFDEHGYFAFGGSTTLVLFQPGAISLDNDLLRNSDKQLETLVKVGNSIGKSTGKVKG